MGMLKSLLLTLSVVVSIGLCMQLRSLHSGTGRGHVDEDPTLPPSPPPLPHPSPPPPSAPHASPPSPWVYDRCEVSQHTEYDGPIVEGGWGVTNIRPDAGACCDACHKQRQEAEPMGKPGCMMWVFCGREGGCGTQQQGECWLKGGLNSARPTVRAKSDACPWTSGTAFTEAEAIASKKEKDQKEMEAYERRHRSSNPKVYFDVKIKWDKLAAPGEKKRLDGGRITFVLYAKESPRHAENFRAMCTGEKGGKFSFNGMSFYRIIDMFIDQAGSHKAGSIWGTSFDDDPGGLKLKHEKPGLLSAANGGPDTNSGHFSIVVAPAPHLDGGYTVFGEVISGHDVMMAINSLSPPGSDRAKLGKAWVEVAGCIDSCDPIRVNGQPVTAKCMEREKEIRPVQGRPGHPCLN